jgi:hypothetical protein
MIFGCACTCNGRNARVIETVSAGAGFGGFFKARGTDDCRSSLRTDFEALRIDCFALKLDSGGKNLRISVPLLYDQWVRMDKNALPIMFRTLV